MEFKFEITLGQAIVAVGFIIHAIGVIYKFGKLEQKVNLMFAWWTKHLQIKNGELSKD